MTDMVPTLKIKKYVIDLIDSYNYKTFDELSYCDKCEFASLIIDSYGDSAYESITEADLDQTVYWLKASLRSAKYSPCLSTALHQAAIKYHEKTMQGLFEEIYDDHIEDIRYEKKFGNHDYYREVE